MLSPSGPGRVVNISQKRMCHYNISQKRICHYNIGQKRICHYSFKELYSPQTVIAVRREIPQTQTLTCHK